MKKIKIKKYPKSRGLYIFESGPQFWCYKLTKKELKEHIEKYGKLLKFLPD